MRLEAGEKNFLTTDAWKKIKKRSSRIRDAAKSFADSFNSRDLVSAPKQQSDSTGGTSVVLHRRTSMGFKGLKTESQSQKAKKMRCERIVHVCVGTFFILIGIFIAVLLPVQFSRKHCQQPGWQKFCLLSATPLFTASTCPCTILDYKCRADVEVGWEHPEVLFECQANASDYDYSNYSPTTIRFCDSNRDCNSFSYCNANGRCNSCTQCHQVRVIHVSERVS